MNNLFKPLVLGIKIIISAFLIYLVFKSNFNDNMQRTVAFILLFFIILPTFFVFFFKKRIFARYPKFIKFWRVFRIIYIIFIVLFLALMIIGFYRRYDLSRTNQAIDFINSKKITLFDIMGQNLLPKPDQKINDSTITGIASIAFSIKNTSFALADSIFDFGQGIVFNVAQMFSNQNIFVASLNSDQNSQVVGNSLVSQDLQTFENRQSNLKEAQLTDISTNINNGNLPKINSNNVQDQIDDILERIDLLRQQIAELNRSSELDDNQNQLDDKNLLADSQVNKIDQQIQQQNNLPKTNSSGGSSNPIYLPILISEVQIGGLTDVKQEFVELYNPNSQNVDLTNWYLQRKTKNGSNYSTFAPNTLFSGKKIETKDYFLIARFGSSFVNSADIIIDNPLTEDNSLALKNPNGDISDKVGWGQAQDYELLPAQNPSPDQSIGRKLISGEDTDTDNNFADFEIDNPTPKAKNITYVAPPTLSPKDTEAPKVIFSLNSTQNNFSFTVNFDITDPMGTVPPSGVDGYTLRWKEETSNWQEDSYKNIDGNPVTFLGTRDFTGNDEKNYYFQIKTKDLAGNESDWQLETPATTKISTFKKVLINEIQIDNKAGTGGTDDDWVELYNPNNIDVSLSGWSVQKFSSNNPCSLNKGFYKKDFGDDAKIPDKSFFLIVGTQAADSLKELADMTLGWSLSDNNTVYLVRSKDKITNPDDSNIVDKVGFGDKSCFPEKNYAPAPSETKSIERKKLSLDTDDNSQDFKISDEPTPKGTFPKVIIQDITDYSNNPSSNSPGAPLYNLLIKWQDPSLNIDFYQVQYKLNDDNWRDWLSKTTQTQEYFQAVYSLLNDNIYSFRVRAQDKDGNQGNWSETTINLTNPVVINEVAYAGTDASPDDQWIELYNRSNKDIDLTGWKIVSGLNGSDTLNLSLKGTILSKGYFILERNDDNSLSDVLADQIFTDPIGKNYFYLRDEKNRYIDEFYMPYNGLDENSFIKDGNHYSVERISPYSFGIYDKNWKINNGKILNGKDKNENQIYGTPGQQNSVYQMYTYYSSSFIQDTTLKKELSPYLFSGFNVQVLKGINLIIEPGVVIKFYDSQSNLTINGTIKAIGTDADKIIFTSFRDDEYGKDSNNDGDQFLPAPGNWLGLYFTKTSQSSNLENINITYGGAFYENPDNQNFTAAIKIDQSSITLKNSIIQKNANNGIWLINSPSVIDNVQFLEQKTSTVLLPAKAIYVQGGSPTIKNSNFEDNTYGIYIDSWHNPDTGEDISGTPDYSENNQFKDNELGDIFTAVSP